MRSALIGLLIVSTGLAQSPPNQTRIKKLIQLYLTAEDPELPALEEELALVPPLTKRDAGTWTKLAAKTLRKGFRGQTRLGSSGTNYLYDEKEKRGRYIISGAGNRKGLVFGLHGGGMGQADCTSAASAFGGVISSAGMIGIFPEAIEATAAAWGDEVTVRFIFDLLAAAQRTFDFDPDRVYVIGHSMGGYGAWTLGGQYADRFAGAVSYAGSPTPVFDLDGRRIVGIQPGVLANRRNLPTFIYHSDDDPRVPIPPVRYAIDELKRFHEQDPAGYVFEYEEVSGRGHDFPQDGPGPALRWIMRFERNRYPKKVVFERPPKIIDEGPPHRYWLEWRKPAPHTVVEGTWDGRSSFVISGAYRPSDVAVLLNDDMVNLDEPVTLRVDDKEVFSAIPERSLLLLLRIARERRDPGLLFTARIGAKEEG